MTTQTRLCNRPNAVQASPNPRRAWLSCRRCCAKACGGVKSCCARCAVLVMIVAWRGSCCDRAPCVRWSPSHTLDAPCHTIVMHGWWCRCEGQMSCHAVHGAAHVRAVGASAVGGHAGVSGRWAIHKTCAVNKAGQQKMAVGRGGACEGRFAHQAAPPASLNKGTGLCSPVMGGPTSSRCCGVIGHGLIRGAGGDRHWGRHGGRSTYAHRVKIERRQQGKQGWGRLCIPRAWATTEACCCASAAIQAPPVVKDAPAV